MGVRFRKSITLAPGLRLNVGKSGVSVNASIPGTGLSWNERIVGAKRTQSRRRSRSAGGRGRRDQSRTASPRRRAPVELPASFSLQLDNDGAVELVDPSGRVISGAAERTLREQNAAMIEAWKEEQCELLNEELEEVLRIHLDTPAPTEGASVAARPFETPAPVPPIDEPLTFWARLLPWLRRPIEARNTAARAEHAARLAKWEAERQAWDRAESERAKLLDPARKPSTEELEQLFEAAFSAVDWPRETRVAFEVSDEGRTLLVDIDLPEFEDLPDTTAVALKTKISMKERSATQRREDYATHIHGVLFRIVGEAFAAWPPLDRVIASGFAQRVNPATGHSDDEYLLSVRTTRREWAGINFDGLDQLDVVAALGNLTLQRHMSASDTFTPIEPWQAF